MSRKRRGLSPDEAALWGRVAESARPLHPARKSATQKAEKAEPAPNGRPAPAKIAPFRIGEAAAGAAPRSLIQPGTGERVPAPPLRMDRKAFDRLMRGKLKPEAKLDLHGHTLAEAHPELIGFMLRAHSAGMRLVLVVTGKGRDSDAGGPIPAPRGVLRQQVPRWLAQPPLASAVLQVTEAHRRHGGSGAYYVYLRRPSRPG